MSLRRSLVPIARSSRFAFKRDAVTYRVLSSRADAERRSGGVSLAVASTLGLSLAAFYALVGDPLHADQPGQPSPLRGDEQILAIRARKSVDSFGLDVPKNTEALLKKYEETHRPAAASGILRYDISQVASNDPLEDDHSESFITSGDSQWSFFAVLDGHSGWETSALLREELIQSVTTELKGIDLQTLDASGSNHDSDPVAAAIPRGFTRLDDRIVHESVDQVFKEKSRNAGTNLLAPAYAGACALLAFYDSKTSLLRVALTGDCRAVLGRKRPDGKFDLEVLTADQNGFNPEEKKRLEAAHPGEEVVKNGRTMGFGPSRAFGDARYKWSKAVQDRLKKDFLGRTPLDSVKTPPYFTAEPVVKATTVNSGDFVVLATDGLWECLTSSEVVGLVGQWVHQQEDRKASWVDSWSQWWGWGSRNQVDLLPVVHDREAEESADDADGTVRYQQWNAGKKFVTVDANVATHLVRNALGGADEDLRDALLSMRSPRARTYWDDITATVVFFGRRG